MTLKRLRGVALGRLRVARRRRAVEEVEVVRPVLDAVAQHVDRAALGDLALQPRQELAPRRAVLAEVERLGRLRLRRPQERRELREVDAVLAVVVLGRAADPAGAAVGRRALADRAVPIGAGRTASPVIAAHDQALRGRARWCRWSRLGLLGHGVEVSSSVSSSSLRERIGVVERLRLIGLVRQPRRRLAHVELAGDHVGDQAGAVLAEEGDFALGAVSWRRSSPAYSRSIVGRSPVRSEVGGSTMPRNRSESTLRFPCVLTGDLAKRLGLHAPETRSSRVVAFDTAAGNEPDDTVGIARLDIENCNVAYVAGDRHHERRLPREHLAYSEPTLVQGCL